MHATVLALALSLSGTQATDRPQWRVKATALPAVHRHLDTNRDGWVDAHEVELVRRRARRLASRRTPANRG